MSPPFRANTTPWQTCTHKNSIAEFEELVAVGEGSSFTEWQIVKMGRQEKHVSANDWDMPVTDSKHSDTFDSPVCLWPHFCCFFAPLIPTFVWSNSCCKTEYVCMQAMDQYWQSRTMTSGRDKKRCSFPRQLLVSPPTGRQLSRYNPPIASTWCPVLFLPAKLFSLSLL